VEILYSATTDTATFLLDADGVCRWVTAAGPVAKDGSWRGKEAAEHCVGAQYVASIDMRVAGGLVDLPRVGAHLVFAARDPQTGRIALLRTGPLVRFTTKKPRRATRARARPQTTQQSGVHDFPTPRRGELCATREAPATVPTPPPPPPSTLPRPAEPDAYESEAATTRFFPDDMLGFRPPPPQERPAPAELQRPPSTARRRERPTTPPSTLASPDRPPQEAIETQARIDVRTLKLPSDHVHEVQVPTPEAYKSRFSKRRLG
jgi:hypothetical protein